MARALLSFIPCVSSGIHPANQGILIIWALGTGGPHHLQQHSGVCSCPSSLRASGLGLPTGLACLIWGSSLSPGCPMGAKGLNPCVWGSVGRDGG